MSWLELCFLTIFYDPLVWIFMEMRSNMSQVQLYAEIFMLKSELSVGEMVSE